MFDRSKFYNDIVYSTTPSDPDAPAPLTTDIKAASSTTKDGITLLQSLLSSVNSRAAPRRALSKNLPFEIGPGLKISVSSFMIFKRQEPKRTSYIYLPPDSGNPQIAQGSSTLVADDTARTVKKAEVRRAFKFGGETISFTTEELAQIKNFGHPELRIIGFKHISMLPIWASLRPSTFIYPSEEEYVGSTRVFSALHQKLLKDEKMGLAWYIARRNASPVLAALLPGAESRSDEGEQLMPPGLWVKVLPFADDIRQAPETNLVEATDPLKDAMRVIVQQLQLPKGRYDPNKFPNPSLQWFYRILQALALDEDVPEPEDVEDRTKPKWKQIHKRAGGYAVEWGEILEEEYRKWQKEHASNVKPTANGGAKRTKAEASCAGGGGKAKKVKEESDGDVSDAVMRAAFAKDAVGKFTVAELRGWLTAKGLKHAGKKAELVEAVNSYMETKMEVD
jgi:ATP-dependent DNA helicase 2 subunit 1